MKKWRIQGGGEERKKTEWLREGEKNNIKLYAKC